MRMTGHGAMRANLPYVRLKPFLHRRSLFFATVSVIGLSSCSGSGQAPAEIAKSIRSRLESLHGAGAAINEEPLLEAKALSRFYEARKASPAWEGKDAEQIVRSIHAIENDGLTPADYHLSAIERLIGEREKAPSPALEADLDILLTDAVAGMVDHVRYGKVRPASLDSTWNVDPREGAPPLEQELDRIAAAGSAADAIEAEKPRHFIYRGLVEALARLREVSAKGGWAAVPPGKSIKPAAADARIPAVHARLLATGELPPEAQTKSSHYDAELVKAVELFQARHRLDPNGVIDKDVIDAMNVSAASRLDQIRVNLERARWVIGGLSDDFLLVNLPAFKTYLIRGGKNVWEGRTQIGDEAKQTPTFRADMRTIVLNPDWSVPSTILAEEVLPGMQKSRDYLAKKKLVVVDKDNQEVDPGSIDWNDATPENFSYTLRQPPGVDNALGRVKFLFPNPYSIYLHDTPSRTLFDSERRTFSHGCIRLERPLELAEILLSGQDGWTKEKIDQVIEGGTTENVALEHPLPVLIVYWTVSVGAAGEIRYTQDFYDLDPPVLAALNAPPQSR
jgi:murein L,D-transpeptidase YcbB/YkuD